MKMDQGAYGWMVAYAKRHYPRVASADYGFDDLLHEGIESYYETLARYPYALDRPHIQALFQKVFNSHIERRVRKKCHTVDFPVGNLHSDDDMPIELHVPEDEMATLTSLVANAPPEIKAVLQLFTTDAGRKKLRAPLRVSPNGYKETFSDRLAVLAGYDMADDVDLKALLKKYFTPEAAAPRSKPATTEPDKQWNLLKATYEKYGLQKLWEKRLAETDPELSPA